MTREAHLRELEDFLNKQMDWDWCWKPFLFLRPSKTTPMGARIILGYFLPSTLLIPPAFAYMAATMAVCFPATLHMRLRPGVHPSLPLITHVAFNILAQPFVQSLLTVAIVTALCVIGLCKWAWNRRATRMQRELTAPPPQADPAAWPPPPQPT